MSERAVRRVCASQLPRMPPKYDGEATGSDLEPLLSIGSLCSALSRHPRLGLPPACGAAERLWMYLRTVVHTVYVQLYVRT